MYGVTVNLIGCDERIMPSAARDVLQRWAALDVDYPTVTALRDSVPAKVDDTRLLVVRVGSADDVQEVNRLGVSYPGWPILAVIDAAGDPFLESQSKRAGALQVVHAPVLADDLQEALDCIAAMHEGIPKLGRLIAVTGAIGGCGGTTVAINLAYELSRHAKGRCILMELSLRKGVLAHHLDISPRYTTTDLVTDIRQVDAAVLQGALTKISENFEVLAGPYDTIQLERADLNAAMQLVQLSRRLSTWLILDVPSTYDDLFFRSLMNADRIVLVADQSVAAIRGVQMVCDSLGHRRPLVVINRYNSKNSGLSVDRIQGLLPGCDVCALTNDRAVVESMNNCQPLRHYSHRSPVLADFDALIGHLQPEAHVDGKQGSILSLLGRCLLLT